MPQVTAVRRVGRDRLAVELDGRAWRTLPEEAVVRAGVAVGCELTRERARALRRELRRVEAMRHAVRTLERRDHTSVSLHARLEARGVGEREIDETIEALSRVGVVDDERYASSRAVVLADRGLGDAAVLELLEREGVAAAAAHAAVQLLEPERDRAERQYVRRGEGVRALRALAARGFCEESLEPLVARDAESTIG
jgi:SOS response regulatory protein OraA/RecX